MHTVHIHTGVQSSETSLFPPTHLTSLGISSMVRNCGSTQGVHKTLWLYAASLFFFFFECKKFSSNEMINLFNCKFSKEKVKNCFPVHVLSLLLNFTAWCEVIFIRSMKTRH